MVGLSYPTINSRPFSVKGVRNSSSQIIFDLGVSDGPRRAQKIDAVLAFFEFADRRQFRIMQIQHGNRRHVRLVMQARFKSRAQMIHVRETLVRKLDKPLCKLFAQVDRGTRIGRQLLQDVAKPYRSHYKPPAPVTTTRHERRKQRAERREIKAMLAERHARELLSGSRLQPFLA